jgi:DNA-binding HxlR family transcriptional regulator
MHKGYGQFCPLAKAAELLCERWTLVVIRELVAGSRQFNDLRRGLPQMSPTLLSSRLKQLVDAGVIKKLQEANGRSAYELTQAGVELEPLVKMMGVWGHRWAASQFEEQDLDVGLLMWDIRRGVNTYSLPTGRAVVEFVFTDAPKGMGQWWLVCEAGEVELCLEDPGHEVDLVIRATVAAMTAVWMCKLSTRDAMKAGNLTIQGATSLKKSLPDWLPGSPLARMGADSLKAAPIPKEEARSSSH